MFTFSESSIDIGVVAFAGDGRLLASRDQGGDVRVFDLATRQEIARLPDNAKQMKAMAVSADGSLLAHGAGIEDGTWTLALWDVELAAVS